MNKILLLLALFALTISCEKSEDEKAAPLLAKIDSLYKAELLVRRDSLKIRYEALCQMVKAIQKKQAQ